MPENSAPKSECVKWIKQFRGLICWFFRKAIHLFDICLRRSREAYIHSSRSEKGNFFRNHQFDLLRVHR